MSDAAITCLVTGAINIVGMLVAFGTIWLKLKYGEDKATSIESKVDNNTKITTAGTAAAVTNAKSAATAASDAKEIAEGINKKLNGGIDSAIAHAIGPIHATFAEHAATDEKNMVEINDRFAQLTEYVHQRNHDLLDALGAQGSKIESLLQLVKRQQPPTNQGGQ